MNLALVLPSKLTPVTVTPERGQELVKGMAVGAILPGVRPGLA